MSSFQKVIKYCAIAFAILLGIGIISGIANAAFAIVSVVSGVSNHNNFNFNFNNNNSKNEKTIDFSETYSDVTSLDLDNATGELKIRIGDTFKVEAENVSENFEAKVNSNGKLTIRENRNKIEFFWFQFDGFNSPNSKITVYLPVDFVAEEAKINTGAGTVSVEGLKAEYLLISAGAGNISGSNLVADEVKIEGGVGNVNFSDVNFADADFDCGVGNLYIEGVLLGENKIDCGVGEVDLDLKGDVDDYDLDIDSGVGTVRLNGEKIRDSRNSNSGADNSIKVDGGVGNVKINIED
jgi:hypothetical protein